MTDPPLTIDMPSGNALGDVRKDFDSVQKSGLLNVDRAAFQENKDITDENDNPVRSLMKSIGNISLYSQYQSTPWELAFYALIAAKNPKADPLQIVFSMPYRKDNFDRIDMVNALANFGYFSQELNAVPAKIDERLLPVLMESKGKNNAPVILLQKTPEGLLIFDTESEIYETRSFDDPEFQKNQNLRILKNYDESKTHASKFMRDTTGYSWVIATLSRFKSTLWQVFLIGLILNLFSVAPPIFIMMIYDRVLGTEAYDTLLMLCMGMVFAITTEATLRRIRSRSLSWLTTRMDHIIGTKLFSQMINLTPSYVENASVAGQISRIKSFEAARDFFSGGVFLSAIELPFTVLSLVLIYILAGPLAIVPAGMALVLLTFFLVMRRVLILQIKKSGKNSSVKQQFTLETLERLTTIKASGMGSLWINKFKQLSGRDATSHFRMQWYSGLAETISGLISMTTVVLLIGYGVQLIWAGTITTGGLIASMILVWRVLGPFQSLCLSVPRLEQLKSSIGQVNTIMDLENEISDRPRSNLGKLKGQLRFENVTMRYSPKTNAVLRDLSFELKPGQTMAVTGKSGSGKSTLLKMIQGLYAWENGLIQVDGFDVRQLDIHDVRRQVSYVPQYYDFFQGSILDNIRVGNPMITETDAELALKFCGALDEVRAMPKGLHTALFKEDGEYLPPSFAFRLTVARMYVQQAPILLIDEMPNQYQHSEMGNLLKTTIEKLKGTHTIIFVTYRDDFMLMADYILTMKANDKAVLQTKAEYFERDAA